MPSLPFRLPVLNAVSRYVVVLPDHRFFVRSVELSVGVGAASIPAQVELALESIAPFPVSQLYWGYWTRPGCERALVYAAYRRRFTTEETETWSDAEWVAPRFAAALTGPAPVAATTWILHGDEDLTALHFGDATGVPTIILSVECAAEVPESERNRIRHELIRRCGGSRSVEDIKSLMVDAGVPGDDELVIRRDLASIELDLDTARHLDVRETAELVSRQRGRMRDTWMWRAFATSIALIGLAGLSEAAIWGTGLWQQTRLEQISQQSGLVSQIETADRLATKIDERLTKRLQPIEMIMALDGPRPNSIVFVRAITEGLYTLVINCEANTSNDFDAYRGALDDLPSTESVAVLRNEVRGARSTLDLRVTFSPDAFLKDNPPAVEGVNK